MTNSSFLKSSFILLPVTFTFANMTNGAYAKKVLIQLEEEMNRSFSQSSSFSSAYTCINLEESSISN